MPTTIGPYTPSFWDRLKSVISNGVVGQSFARSHPSWAEGLGIHPTEDPGDPGYAEHSQQILPLGLMLPHPEGTVQHEAHGVLNGVGAMTTPSQILSQILTFHALKAASMAAPLLRFASPVLSAAQASPSIYQAIQNRKQGNHDAEAENMGEAIPNLILAGASLPDAVEALPGLKGVIASEAKLNTPLPNENVSPRQIYETAKGRGINLDAAQATSGKALIPKAVKAVTEHSLFGGGAYDANNEANKAALLNWAADAQHGASPKEMSREDFGDSVSSALKAHQQSLMDQSSDLFGKLSDAVGDTQPDTTGVRSAAQKIIDANSAYYANHPELLKGGAGQAWSIVKDLAGAPKTKVTASPIVDASGKPFPGTETPKPADTWSDLQKLRSDLMNLYRSPDIAGSRSEGWLKQLTAATDDAMTSGSNALSPENLANFREANDLFSRAKEYDDPSSPFYHLLRSPDGLTTANTLAGLKPERVRQFNTAMTETGNDDLNAQLQRQAINRLISPSGGEPDLKNLPTRLSRTQVEQLGGVLQPDQISNLQDLARTSRIVHADSNTSGSGKVVQRVLEGTAALKGLGTAAAGVFHANPEMVAAGLGASVVEPSLTGALAKLATNPSVVESLMAPKPALQSPSLTIPSLLAGSVLNGKDDDKPKPLTPSQKPESDADVMKRLGLTAEPTAPATAPAKPESDEDVIKRLGLTAEEKPDNQ